MAASRWCAVSLGPSFAGTYPACDAPPAVPHETPFSCGGSSEHQKRMNGSVHSHLRTTLPKSGYSRRPAVDWCRSAGFHRPGPIRCLATDWARPTRRCNAHTVGEKLCRNAVLMPLEVALLSLQRYVNVT